MGCGVVITFMKEPNRAGSPLEGASDVVDPHVTDAFRVLGDETRLAILLALWGAYDPHGRENAVPFSELRERVGIRQGAQFNYHLDKLVGRFVDKTDDGYELGTTGRGLVQSIIAGIGFEDSTLEPTEIDAPCGLCGAPTEITYREGRVYQCCTECAGLDSGDDYPSGTLLGWTFEPTGLTDRTAEELLAASTIKNYGRIALRFEGICPDCSGPVKWSLDICEEHEPAADGNCPNCERADAILARETCTVCKSHGWGSPSIKVLFHPAVVSFHHDHEIDIGFTGDTDYTDVVRTLSLVEGFDEEVVSMEPPQVRVIMSQDSNELHLLLDEDLTVIESTRHDISESV